MIAECFEHTVAFFKEKLKLLNYNVNKKMEKENDRYIFISDDFETMFTLVISGLDRSFRTGVFEEFL